jgi:hypothetical protein
LAFIRVQWPRPVAGRGAERHASARGVAFVVLLVLKIVGVTTWSSRWVPSPLWPGRRCHGGRARLLVALLLMVVREQARLLAGVQRRESRAGVQRPCICSRR